MTAEQVLWIGAIIAFGVLSVCSMVRMIRDCWTASKRAKAKQIADRAALNVARSQEHEHYRRKMSREALRQDEIVIHACEQITEHLHTALTAAANKAELEARLEALEAIKR